MEDLAHDLRYAVRTLLRMRGVAAVAIATLALGIGATTTMFSVVYATLLRPLPFAEPDRLLMLYVTRTTPREGFVRMRWSRPGTEPLYGTRSFEQVASYTPSSIAISGGESVPEQIDTEFVSPSYFRALRITPAAGRVLRDEEDGAPNAHPVAVLSDRLWRRRFGANPSMLGATIRMSDVPLTVVGIAPPGFVGLSGKSELWMPRTMAPRLSYSDYLTTPQHFISVVARLRAEVSVAQANAELAAMGDRFADAGAPADAAWSAMAIPVGRARVEPTLRRSVLVLLGASVCVLLISCVNAAGLLLARARTRRREIAIRLAMGSSRARLVRQLLTEGLLMAAIAGAIGTLLAAWGVALFARTSPGLI